MPHVDIAKQYILRWCEADFAAGDVEEDWEFVTDQWSSTVEDLQEILDNNFPDVTDWRVFVFNIDWDKRSGSRTFEAENADEFLRKLLHSLDSTWTLFNATDVDTGKPLLHFTYSDHDTMQALLFVYPAAPEPWRCRFTLEKTRWPVPYSLDVLQQWINDQIISFGFDENLEVIFNEEPLGFDVYFDHGDSQEVFNFCRAVECDCRNKGHEWVTTPGSFPKMYFGGLGIQWEANVEGK